MSHARGAPADGGRRGLLALGLGAWLAGCGDKPGPAAAAAGGQPGTAGAAATAGGAASAPAQPVLRVGIDPAYPPFASLDARGQMVGFDIDLVHALARHAGWQLSLLSTPWADLFDALGRGERDLLISAITITEERRRRALFTDPYFRAEQLVVARPGLGLRRLDDLKRWRVAVQAGTVADVALREALGPRAGVALLRHDTADKALRALAQGAADAVACDSGPVLHRLMQQPPGAWVLVPELAFRPSHYGIAVHPSRADLLKGLAEAWTAVQRSGEYDALMTRYFGPAGRERAQVGSRS